jgi:hypothetical protein
MAVETVCDGWQRYNRNSFAQAHWP